MSTPAYKVSIKASGTPTASTGNAFTQTTSSSATQTFQISSTAKRVFDRTIAPSGFKTSTGGTISSTIINSVNYNFGKVTFNSTTLTTSITGDVTHLPLSVVAGANSFTLNMSRELLDDTDFSSTGFRSREVGLADVQLSLSRWYPVDFDWVKRLLSTSVLSTQASTGSNEVVVELRPSTSGAYAIGYFNLESEAISGDVAGLENSDLSLMVSDTTASGFRWSDQ